MGLAIQEVTFLRDWLNGPWEVQGPFVGRDLSVGTDRLRLGNTSGLGTAVGSLSASSGRGARGAPDPSYQSLFFDTVSGSVPAGAQEFVFDMEPVPFIGAITEIDVIASDPGQSWLMMIDVEGLGAIFRAVQPLETLPEAGWFRPTPPGFWPETEGLVFPLPSVGLRPRVRVRRESDAAPDLILRVLVVAHPG